MLPKGTLGPGILGQEQFEREKHETTKGRGIFGPGITGEEPEPPEPKVPKEPEAFPHMSVEKLKDALIGNPAFLDSAIETEFQRESGPRIGALKAFIETEREGQGREDVIQRLEGALRTWL